MAKKKWIPEQRECIDCGVSYIAKQPLLRCRGCVNKINKIKRDSDKLNGLVKPKPKRIDSSKVFRDERKGMEINQFRKEWRVHIVKKWEEITSNEERWRELNIPLYEQKKEMEFFDRHTHKNDNKTNEYPDTRDWHLD
jgi:hypothetical protein